MSMLEELWLGGLDYQDRPVKKGSAMERKLCLYAKNSDRMKAMLSEQQKSSAGFMKRIKSAEEPCF